MKVFFDNCTAPVLATTLDAFISGDGHRSFHIRDVPGLPSGRDSKDVDWIDHLRRSTDHWIFVSGDLRILRNAPERAALRSAGLHGFVLAPAYQRTPPNQVVATLIWKWPQLLDITKLDTSNNDVFGRSGARD